LNENSELLESEIDMSSGGDPSEEADCGDMGVMGVSGDGEGVFNKGEGKGVRGDNGQELGSGISLGLEVDSRADGTDSDAEAVVKSLVARRVQHVLTRNPDSRGIWWEASLTVGGREKAMTEVFDQNMVPREEPNQASGRQ
jgi:hypothetical protein